MLLLCKIKVTIKPIVIDLKRLFAKWFIKYESFSLDIDFNPLVMVKIPHINIPIPTEKYSKDKKISILSSTCLTFHFNFM